MNRLFIKEREMKFKKIKLWHIALSLTIGCAMSFILSVPALNNIHSQALASTQEEVEKVYAELNQALVNADTVNLQRLLADGFVLETLRGDILYKQEWIRSIQRGIMRYQKADVAGIKAIGRNQAYASSILMGEVWDNKDTWKIIFHLETIKKGKMVQIKRMSSQIICESSLGGINNMQREGCQQAFEIK